MSIWTLLQIVFNLLMFAGMVALFLRLRRPPQDDPRLSRGLQLLQTKITVLEDLSDRTDAQVKTLSSLLDQKNRVLQNKILEAEQQVLKIDHSMEKSMEVAEIFQDKIPHQEILERQRTVEYVKAARMAHSGMAVDEIAQSVHLPREQVELIAKFNREQLMFDETQLPGWVSKGVEQDTPPFALGEMSFVVDNGMDRPAPDQGSQQKIGDEFRSAVKTAREVDHTPMSSILDNKMGETLKAGVAHMQPAVMSMKATAQTLREKLVATAEDLLKSQNTPAARVSLSAGGVDVGSPAKPPSKAPSFVIDEVGQPPPPNAALPSTYNRTAAAPPARTHIVRSPDSGSSREGSPEIKKVIFPKLDR